MDRDKIIDALGDAVHFARGENFGARTSSFIDGQPLPPFPWEWCASETPSANGAHHIYLVDSTGRKIAALWGKGPEKEAMARLIVEVINGVAHA